ncbi:MAG: NAD(P)-binding protein [Planctomycetales bacterium]|nr:NAD(P)-binding protein [Planctomycetales bacterium]
MSDSFEKPMAESVETKAHSGSQCSERVWDVICIGSGTGSLAAATALARLGRSVLVLESHSQFGGLTHTFARRGQRWATGFHYTGWPTAYANDFPELWSTLTRDRAPWQKLPEDNDVYLRPDARVSSTVPPLHDASGRASGIGAAGGRLVPRKTLPSVGSPVRAEVYGQH